MADNTQLNAGSGGDIISTDDLGTSKVQNVKVAFGPTDTMTQVSTLNPLPVTAPASQAVTGTFWQATQPVSAVSLPLPTGAALDSTLSTMSAKLPALGQNTTANSQPVVPSSDFTITKVTGAATQTATVNNILTAASGSAATDVSNFRSFAIQVISTGTGGTYIFEGSNDNVNFQTAPVYPMSSSPAVINGTIAASASQFVFQGACSFTFLRCRIATLITGGSIQAFSTFFPGLLSQTVTAVGNSSNNLNISTVATITTLTQLLASAAAADGKANPTMAALQSIPFLFNGTTWDRNYANYNTTTTDTGAKIASGNGATQTNFNARGAEITVLFSAASGTFTAMHFQLQFSFDVGTTWKNFGPATTDNLTPSSTDTYTFMVYPSNISQTAGTSPTTLVLSTTQTVAINAPLPRTWRMTWTITGTSPSVTITAIYVNYQL